MVRQKVAPVRSKLHLARLRRRRCCVPGCRRVGQHAHHVRKGAGTGMKPGDDKCVNFCPEHHGEGHLSGWQTFEAKYDLDLSSIAARLWTETEKP
jgi:hypothetical protein